MSVNKYFPDKFCREKCPQDKFPQPLSSADLQIMVYRGILVTRKNLSWQKILSKYSLLYQNYNKFLWFFSIYNIMFQHFLQNYKNLTKTDNILFPIILYFAEICIEYTCAWLSHAHRNINQNQCVVRTRISQGSVWLRMKIFLALKLSQPQLNLITTST